eukprot:5079584-Prymnesium_polylepis.1
MRRRAPPRPRQPTCRARRAPRRETSPPLRSGPPRCGERKGDSAPHTAPAAVAAAAPTSKDRGGAQSQVWRQRRVERRTEPRPRRRATSASAARGWRQTARTPAEAARCPSAAGRKLGGRRRRRRAPLHGRVRRGCPSEAPRRSQRRRRPSQRHPT